MIEERELVFEFGFPNHEVPEFKVVRMEISTVFVTS